MCLEIFIQISPNAKARVGARRLSEATGLHISKKKHEGEAVLHFSATGGCSCDFLGKGASLEAAVWVLAEEHLPALARAIELLGEESKKFSFLARWYDAPAPTETKKVSRGALAETIRGNKVGNNVLYKVG
jgi:hypothetical protein